MSLTKCPCCGQQVSNKIYACHRCGFLLHKIKIIKCPECHATITNVGDHCPYCGYPMSKIIKKKSCIQKILSISKAVFILILFGILGSYIGGKTSSNIGILVGVLVGLIIGIIVLLYVFFRKEYYYFTYNNITNIPLIDHALHEIETELTLRSYAAERLHIDDFWLQTISIFYSCFTAILAVLSLRDDTNFITVPSAIFTVTVAILVTYANAQRYAERANDLKANCNDLRISLTACYALEEEIKNSEYYKSCKAIPPRYITDLQNIMNDFTKKLGDSENHSIVDEWRYNKDNSSRFYYYFFHLLPLILLITFFFAVPIYFIAINFHNFGGLFRDILQSCVK